MDNITHTLIGALVGDAAYRWLPAGEERLPTDTRRTLGIAIMVAGNNLPDLDFLYSTATGSRLDYLLQHRGYSHTFVGALLIAATMLLAVRAWVRRRGQACSASDWRYLCTLALLAPLVHIGLDFTNSYGVHPLWPFDNHWMYGDAVFILEPLLWACAAPLVFTLRSALGRTAVALTLAAALVLAPASHRVALPFELLLAAAVVAMLVAGRLLSTRTALMTGTAAWLAVTGVFFVASRTADARIEVLARQAFPSATTLDRVLTPLPANPLCHELLLLQVEADSYVIRSGMHSLAPAWLPATACAPRGGAATVGGVGDGVLLSPVTASSTDALQWRGEIVMPRQALAALHARHCSVRALLAFARAPWSAGTADAATVGDLRFASQPGDRFATVQPATDDARCPRWLPAWTPPRQDLLDGAAAR